MKWLQPRGSNLGDFARLSPVLYVAGMQYFAVQFLVALRWPRPYNISRDTISDLGNTACGIGNTLDATCHNSETSCAGAGFAAHGCPVPANVVNAASAYSSTTIS